MQKPKIAVLGLFGRSAFLSVDHFHGTGETLHARDLYIEPGGKGYNQAVAASRLGGKVTFFGCGGQDDDCDACTDFLDREGIDHCIQRTPHAPTAYACILTDREGENRVTVFRGAADRFSADFIRENSNALAQADLILLNLEYPDAVNEAVLQIAGAHQIPVVMNPAPAKKIPDGWIPKLRLLTPNRQEAASLAGVAPDVPLKALARALNACGITRAVVTLGADGALLVDGHNLLHFPGIPVKAADTTGAGDTFNGALAVCLAKGMPLVDCVSYAIHASALQVQKPFVMPAIPYEETVRSQYAVLTPVAL